MRSAATASDRQALTILRRTASLRDFGGATEGPCRLQQGIFLWSTP
jgi:hypothetical protein